MQQGQLIIPLLTDCCSVRFAIAFEQAGLEYIYEMLSYQMKIIITDIEEYETKKQCRDRYAML